MPSSMAPADLIPADHDPKVEALFIWYTRRLFRRRFHAFRLMHGSVATLASLADHTTPAIVVMTHASWWDPLAAFLLHRTLTPSRAPAAPMDSAMLRKFRFFRRLGVFGIDPDSPASLQRMGRHVTGLFDSRPDTTLWVTGQGEFHDPRAAQRLRPGPAWIAARTTGVRVLCCALEYAFWLDQKPEVFARIDEAPSPRSSTTPGWLRAMRATLQGAASALAHAVITRDPAGFEPLPGTTPGRASINPTYDLWLRLTGRGDARVRTRGPGGTP